MLRIPGMPFLPGTTFPDRSQQYFPRRQKFVSINGITMLSDRKPPCLINELGVIEDPACPPYELPSLYPPKIGPKLPPWLAFNKKTLCFYAYFKETLQEVYRAPYQVRKVKIYYYLEDGTIQISEPRILNSGIPQGCLVCRQRIPRPPPCQNEFISILDINVNQTLRVFDRIYHITGCDLFTRHFMNRSGIHVPDPVETPNMLRNLSTASMARIVSIIKFFSDPSFMLRQEQDTKPKPDVPPKYFAFQQFLEKDRQVLCFQAYWDDRSEFGDIRNLEICYYLADDTLEIKEIFPINSGRDSPSIFLRRTKLPKQWTGMPLPGVVTHVTVLNVLGKRHVVDSLQTGAKPIKCYQDIDLQIGCHVNVYGRDVILTNCDGFTKEYYRKKYGLENFTPIHNPAVEYRKCAEQQKERELPPFNGWGSHESSEGNCISVELKPPKFDFKKFVKLDRFILRFGAKMMSQIKENCIRLFIISYYLSSDELSIYELGARNTGFLGGEFLKRRRVKLPKQNLLTPTKPKYYKPYHFFVGATVNIEDHLFYIVSADEYTLLYMENHPFEFSNADVKTIITKIREAIRPDYKNFVCQLLPHIIDDLSGNCVITYEILHKALVEVLDKNINEQEIIALCRHYAIEKSAELKCKRETVRSAVHLEIRRSLWDSFDRLREHIYHIVPQGNGFLPADTLRSIIRACRLPFHQDFVNNIFEVLNRNECGELEINDFLNFIDSAACRAPPIIPLNIFFQLCPNKPDLSRGKLVDWNRLLCDIGLQEQLEKESE